MGKKTIPTKDEVLDRMDGLEADCGTARSYIEGIREGKDPDSPWDFMDYDNWDAMLDSLKFVRAFVKAH